MVELLLVDGVLVEVVEDVDVDGVLEGVAAVDELELDPRESVR